ncbi:MAG: hypothetical protein JWP74_1530 [Marmoricola sp.]|nr:hypothetical protein [Marmoricola sp.]
MDRALPGHMIDLIHDGVRSAELKAKGDRAVYGALFRTAASAMQRGWTQVEWADQVMDPRRELGRQALLKRGRPRGPVGTEKFLVQAWDGAAAWLKTADKPFTGLEVEDEAGRRWELAMLAVADPERVLSDHQRAVLSFVSERAAKIGTLRVAVPQKMLREELSLGQTAARNALDRLCKLGYLELVERGRPGGKKTKDRRANVYAVAPELPMVTASPVPETGWWCPPAVTSGAPLATVSGALEVTSGAPTVNEPNREERTVITLTYSPEGDITVTLPDATPREVIEALQARSVGVVLDSELLADNVAPIFGGHRDRQSGATTWGASS